MTADHSDPAEIDLRGADIGLPPPSAARSAIMTAVTHPCGLSTRRGSERTRELLSAHLTRRLWRAAPEQIVVTAGSSSGLSALLLAWTAVDDVVLIPDPGFPAHRTIIERLGRQCWTYRMAGDPLSDLERLLPRAQMIIWNAPHNPTGAVPRVEDSHRLASLADKHGVYLVSDEVNHDLTWGAAHTSPLPFANPARTAGLWSASKSLRMAGMRIGCVMTATAAEQVARAAWALTMGPAVPSEAACVAALGQYEATLAESRKHTTDGFVAAVDALRPLSPVAWPESGLCLWWDVRWTGLPARDFADLLNRNEHVRIWPGERFGSLGAGYVRINVAAPHDELAHALVRLVRFCRLLLQT